MDTPQTDQSMTKRQRRELRYMEKQENRTSSQRKRLVTRWLLAGVGVLALGGITFAIIRASGPSQPPVQPADNPFRGGANAAVVMTEFSDFSCPACASVAPTVEELYKVYGDKIKIVFSGFNLGHTWSEKSLEAGKCAADQGKFWEFHDLVFAKQSEWASAKDATEKLKSYATEVGVDAGQFATCLDGGSKAALVKADTAYGRSQKVDATPTFIVNGESIVGAKSLEEFKQVIDTALAAAPVSQ